MTSRRKEFVVKKITFTLIGVLLLSAAAAAQSVAFVGVNVIPMDRERVLQNQTVLVRNGIISEIASAGKVKTRKLRRARSRDPKPVDVFRNAG